MATYYVRTDGSNSNAGTGPATNQAWQTVTYALANMVLTNGTNYLYIAPGAYREAPTVTITPSSTQTLVISGDPTASQFSGVTAGVVRFTNFTSDTANPGNANILTISGKTYITIENIYFDMYNTTGLNYCILGASNPNFITVQKCVFIGQDNGGFNVNGIQLSTSTTINVTVEKCIFVRMYISFWLVSTATAGTSQTVSVTRSLFLNNDIASIYMTGNGLGRTVYNCTFAHSARGCVGLVNAEASSTGVYNCLFYAGNGTALSTNGVGIVENYNRFVAINPRSNVSPSGANSTSGGVAGLDYGYGLLTGIANQQMLSTIFGSPNYNFGTTSSAPVSDMYGVTWTGANPDAGSATYRSLSAVGAYNPTERNASTITIAPGSTSQSIELYLGATGLTASTSGLSARYNRTRTASVNIPLVARTIAQAWTSGGFAEVDATNMPGVYRLDLPDAALAAGADDVTVVVRGASGTNGAVMTIKLSSGGLTSAQTASAVWGASPAGYNDATTFGGVVIQIDQTATGISTQVQDVAGDVWDELKVNHTIANSFGDYLDTKVSTGADTSRIQLRQGPFLIKQNAVDSVITEVNQFLSTTPNIEMVLIDSSGGSVSVAGSTLVMRVRNQAGTAVVNNITPTVAYADGGVIRWSPNLSWNALGVTTAGTYRIVVERTMSGVTTTFGPFLVQLSSG